MALTSGRIKVKILRGTYSAIFSSLANLSDGELCYATDRNRLYMVEGTTLTDLDYTVDSEVIEKIQDVMSTTLVEGTGIGISYNDNTGQITVSYTGTSTGITALAQATDVNVASKVDKSVLVYDASTDKFVANNVNTVITLTDGGNF